MLQSQLFTKTSKEAPKDEESINASLLMRAGFIDKLMAGVYTFLPLGWRVLNKIENIVREEMNKINGQEIFMPVLHPKENWEKTGRWQTFETLYKLKNKAGTELALGPTHEEIIYPLLTHHVSSYKDLPMAIYQIQTKFRDELRAKSGLLRGREFRMKDLYSFHANDQDRDRYYEMVKKAYLKIFKRMELDTIITQASGGTFSELSLEFQVPTNSGEDTIFVCQKCATGINKEIIKTNDPKCPHCGKTTIEKRAIEVGNIFPLKEKFARDFNLVFRDKDGQNKFVSVGCYGLGTSRAMGTIVEIYHGQNGIIWPKEIAPFQVHLLILGENKKIKKEAERLYQKIQEQNIEILYDDRDLTAGEKFAEADLIGIPLRLVISEKTLRQKSAEIKLRDKTKVRLIKLKNLKEILKLIK